MLFGTTKEFMTHFGLKSLADLPKPRELEELLAEGQQKALDLAAAGADGDEPHEHGDDLEGTGELGTSAGTDEDEAGGSSS